MTDFPVFTLETRDDGSVNVFEDEIITEQAQIYAEKRNHVDKSKIDYVIVFEKGKNWQIAQDRYSGNTYLIVLDE
jgi:hypothetical protein